MFPHKVLSVKGRKDLRRKSRDALSIQRPRRGGVRRRKSLKIVCIKILGGTIRYDG